MNIIEGQYRIEGSVMFEVNKDMFYKIIGPIEGSTSRATGSGRHWELRTSTRLIVGVSESNEHFTEHKYFINRSFLR